MFAGLLAGRADPAGRERVARLSAGGAEALLDVGPLTLACAAPSVAGSHEDGPSCVLCGSLYNAEELAGELGCPAEASAATLVWRGWQRWGAQVLGRLRGAFHLALWDHGRRTGFVSHDHMGDCALFTGRQDGRLWVGGEVATILALVPRRPAPDTVSAVHWLADRTIPLGRTMYETVERVGNGRALRIDATGAASPHVFWSPRWQPPAKRTRSEREREVLDCATRAVARRLAPTGSTAVMLSGGLDSSLVAALARTRTDRLRGYSAVFPDRPAMDEGGLIASLAGHLGIPGTGFAMRAQGAFATSLEYLGAWQTPLVGPGYLFESCLARQAAAEGSSRLLDGQGGDEVFGGSFYVVADALRRGRLVQGYRRLRALPGARTLARRELRRPAWEIGFKGALPHAVHRLVRRSRAGQRHAPGWMLPAGARLFEETDDPWAWKRRAPGPRWWQHTRFLLLDVSELGARNDYVRHRAAQAGLEGSPPLFDVDLIELSLSTPPTEIHATGMNRGIARSALTGLAPDALRLNERKSNFAAFYHDCLRADLPAIRRLLGDGAGELGAFVDVAAAVEDLVDGAPAVGEQGWLGWAPQVWGLLTLECFMRLQRDPHAPDAIQRALSPPQPSWDTPHSHFSPS